MTLPCPFQITVLLDAVLGSLAISADFPSSSAASNRSDCPVLDDIWENLLRDWSVSLITIVLGALPATREENRGEGLGEGSRGYLGGVLRLSAVLEELDLGEELE